MITPACKMTDVETHETLRNDDEAARPGVLVGYVSEQLANERWELKGAVGADIPSWGALSFDPCRSFALALLVFSYGTSVPFRC